MTVVNAEPIYVHLVAIADEDRARTVVWTGWCRATPGGYVPLDDVTLGSRPIAGPLHFERQPRRDWPNR
jgi:hypothetical protein